MTDRVAFVVLAHDDVTMTRRLLSDLAPYPVYLHLDRDTPVEPFVQAVRASPTTVRANPRRVCVHWAGFSVLEAMLDTLAFALEHGEPALTYVFLSGHCLAVRPVAEFVDHLDTTPPVHCRAFALREGPDVGIGQSLDRVRRRHFFDGAVGHAAKRSPLLVGGVRRRVVYPAARGWRTDLPDVVHACGSQWTALPRDLAVEVVETHRRGGFDYLRDAYASDEMAISTFVHNRPRWAEQTQAGGLEVPPLDADVSWMPNFHHLREGLHGYLGEADLEAAIADGSFFTRKVSGEQLPSWDVLRDR